MASRRVEYVTKPGKHGTLYLYSVTYTDGFGRDKVRMWGYSKEDVEERFFRRTGPESSDEGWEIISIERVRSDRRLFSGR